MKEILSYSENLACLNQCALEIYFIKVGSSLFLPETIFLHKNLNVKKNKMNITKNKGTTVI
jgi:hypothetical protein